MRSLLLFVALMLSAHTFAQNRPLKMTAIASVSGTTWTYNVTSKEPATSALRCGVLSIPISSPISNVFVPSGWGFDTDFHTYIVWYCKDTSPISDMVQPGKTLSMGFTVPTGVDAIYDQWLAASWSTATSQPGPNATGNINTPILRPRVASLLVSSSMIGPQDRTGTVNLVNPAGPNGVDVILATSDPVITVPRSVFVPAGTTTASFLYRASDPDSATVLTVSATCGGKTKSKAVTVNPNPISKFTLSRTEVVGGSATTVKGSILLQLIPTADSVVTLVSSDPTVVEVPISVVVRAGSQKVTFILTHHPVLTTRTITITASKGGGSMQAVLSVIH